MIMNHIELALTGLTTVCLLLLPITLIVLRRISKELVSLNVTTSKLSETQSDRTEGTAAQSATALNDLSDSVAEMKRDFEWLVSDRMIELAVNMAGTGHPQDRISKHTGISASELEAIQKIAKH
jgi:hypothetical protein